MAVRSGDYRSELELLTCLVESSLGVEHTDAISVVSDLDRRVFRWDALDTEVIIGLENMLRTFRLEVDGALRWSEALE